MKKLLSCTLMSLVVCFVWAGIGVGSMPEWDTVVIAHRGMSPGFPENTLSAFRNAIELGVDIIELDLRATLDGVIVVLHEDAVDTTTNGEGFVFNYTFDELRQLDAGSHAGDQFAGERIPSLEEVLDLVIPLGGKLLLDIKASDEIDPATVVRMLERHHALLDVIIGVRSVEDAQLFRQLNPNLRQMAFLPTATDMDEFVEAGVDILRLWARWIHIYPPFVEMAHAFGKPVWVTAGYASRDELEELLQLGADGLITDLPDVLIEIIEEQETP